MSQGPWLEITMPVEVFRKRAVMFSIIHCVWPKLWQSYLVRPDVIGPYTIACRQEFGEAMKKEEVRLGVDARAAAIRLLS